MLDNPEQMLPARSVIRLLEESAAASGCITFGLRMAEHRGLADLGMVSLLIAHQPTLGDALSVLTQYRNRIKPTSLLRVEEFDEMVMLRENFVVRPANPVAPGRRPGAWRARPNVPQRARQQLEADRDLLAYEPPPLEELRIFQRMFSSPIEFSSEFEGILLNRPTSICPIPGPIRRWRSMRANWSMR